MKFDALIFDLDGTLWDSTETVCAVWNGAFSDMGLDFRVTAEDIRREMGKLLSVIMDDLAPGLSPEKQDELYRRVCEAENRILSERGGKLYPELERTLELLGKKYRLFIVSNCQQGYIEAFLAAHKLGRLFEGHLCHGDTNLPKSGTNRLLAERFGLKNPVYIGDTQGDLDAATEAGIPFIHAAYGFGTANGGIGSVKSPSELPILLSSAEEN